MTRHLILNAFIFDTGHHESAWRLPESNPRAGTDVKHFQNLARIAERGKLDSVFLADAPTLESNPGRRPGERLDPTVLLAAIAAVTERLGLIGTASTSFEEPYNLARRFGSLDHVSNGRAGWNVVTTVAQSAAANFGLDKLPDATDRYRRAEEFLHVINGLWDSWEEDAVVADKENGVYADEDKIHALDHEGEFFRVAGPLNAGRLPQGRPVIVQAGSSPAGIALAAEHAEAVFTAQPTVEESREFYARLKNKTAEAGRHPDSIKILPGIVPVIGGTVAEAKEKEHQLGELMVLDHALHQLARDTGLKVGEIDLDAPLPTDIRPFTEVQSSRYELTVNLARRENLTVRELLVRLGGGRGHRVFAGTPEQVADTIEEWFTTGAADGFNIMAPVLPSGLESFVDHVVPILQRRGLFRTDYTGSTLREHLGLAIPENVFVAQQTLVS